MKYENVIGTRISDLLKKQGMSQRELAVRANITDVSLSRYIKGERVPNGPVLANIATALHTTADDLLGRDVPSDSELEYYRTQRAIARNAKNWTPKQKADLVNALFEVE